MQRFSGKVVVVTGATAGIGLATAERFQSEGAHVIICSRKSESVTAVCKELNCDGVPANVSSASDREKLVSYVKDKYGRIDVLVLNVATSLAFGCSQDCSESAWDKMMSTNVKSAWMLSNSFLPFMTEGSGSVIIVSSYAGYNPGIPLGPYGVTKTALLGLTRMLANEFGRSKRVRVNCVAPGIIKTKFSKSLWESPEIKKHSEDASLLGRIGLCEEVAGPIAFLASSDASYITGETLVVAGGTYCRL
jgi:dehydrogenase/reductase SDR family protein 4